MRDAKQIVEQFCLSYADKSKIKFNNNTAVDINKNPLQAAISDANKSHGSI